MFPPFDPIRGSELANESKIPDQSDRRDYCPYEPMATPVAKTVPAAPGDALNQNRAEVWQNVGVLFFLFIFFFFFFFLSFDFFEGSPTENAPDRLVSARRSRTRP